uniref:Putative secreted protein n=1 Tax=Panstrongylus lignarius TaxID=156445 RepID=A0A224Y508_9HEMI
MEMFIHHFTIYILYELLRIVTTNYNEENILRSPYFLLFNKIFTKLEGTMLRLCRHIHCFLQRCKHYQLIRYDYVHN